MVERHINFDRSDIDTFEQSARTEATDLFTHPELGNDSRRAHVSMDPRTGETEQPVNRCCKTL